MVRTFSLALLAVLLLSALALAQFRTVTVQNANNNPVPTTIQNTPTVNVSGTVPVSGTVGISGTPSVNATITGTPSVSVTGTPTVSVTNLPTGTAGPAPTTVTLVKDLDNPAQQPFQNGLSCATIASGATSCFSTLTVPAGKELVIEYVQISSRENAGSTTAVYLLTTTVGGLSIAYSLAPGTAVVVNGNNVRIGEHLTRIYADPGTTVRFDGSENSNSGTVIFTALLSGHLVNVP